MTLPGAATLQFWLLAGISLLLVWLTPSAWYYTPDGGIYVGTARNLAETGRYWFNGYPNLLYYPGLSGVLSLLILGFGLDFHVINLVFTGVAVACIWLAWAQFPLKRYGYAGLAVPVLLITASEFNRQVFNILSDALFLALVLGILALWRKFEAARETKALLAGGLLAACAPLVRFEGLLICAAFWLALVHVARRDGRLGPYVVLRLIAIGGAIVLPFMLWTLRNIELHTPDTFNVANQFFFGLKGLALYANEAHLSQTPTPMWMSMIIRIVLFVSSFAEMTLGSYIVRQFPSWLWFLAIVGLCALGAPRWFRAANVIERIFVVLSLVFLLLLTLKGGHSRYIVARYWLPVTPFVLLMIGCGFTAIYESSKGFALRRLVSVFAASLAALAAINGASQISYLAGKQDYYQNAAEVLERTASFVSEHVPQETAIATTDWGIMPFFLKRPSYQVLNDPSHEKTLERMAKYRTGFLVVFEDLAAFPPVAEEMVRNLPGLFSLVFEAVPKGSGPTARVYSVDLAALQTARETLTRNAPARP